MRLYRKIFAVILAAVLMASCFSTGALATENLTGTETQTGENPGTEKTPEEIAKEELEKAKQATYALPVRTNELAGWPQGPGTYGTSAIVMEAESGAVLYAKNMNQKEFPASITKVLTALVAYRYGDENSQVAITPESLECLGLGYASIGMKDGNVLPMKEAMMAMLMASSNEVAYAIGETVGQTQGADYEWFLRQMNLTAKELGCSNSNFVNTNGVHDEDHYTCAMDMARIGSALFEYPAFFEVCQTQQYKIEACATTEEHVFQQKHEMLIPNDSEYYDKAVGGKTGYTTEANNTLITMAEDESLKLVCVVLNTFGGHVYSDTRALLEYGFQNFEKVYVAEQETEPSITYIPEDAYVILPAGVAFARLDKEIQPITGGETAANEAIVTYSYEGIPVGEVTVEVNPFFGSKKITIASPEENLEEAGEEVSPIRKTLVVVGIAIVLVCVGIMCVILHLRLARKRKIHRKRRGR